MLDDFIPGMNKLKDLHGQLQGLIRTRLWARVLVGMVAGIGVGFMLGPSVGWVPESTANIITHWLAFPGNLFLGLVKMIIIPLIVSSIVIGINSSGDMEKLRRMGLYIVVYFLLTTTVAIGIGLAAASLVRPGDYVTLDEQTRAGALSESRAQEKQDALSVHSIPEKLVDLIPENPLSSMVYGELLGVVIFTLIIGLALLAMKRETAAPIVGLLESLQEVCITVVKWAMKIVPLAVFGLMTRLTATTGMGTLRGMGVYILTVLGGLLVLLVVYMVIVAMLARRNPFRFMAAIRDVQLLAFSTSSSAAVMPTSMKIAEDQLGVRPSISQFIIPIGATVNMDGTALYQGAAALFLAQVFGVDLSLPDTLLLVSTTVAASIGAPSAPGIGIVVLASVLQGVGIPPSGIALIIGVDRILDMSRTAVNVTGDLTASVVFDRWFGNEPAQEK